MGDVTNLNPCDKWDADKYKLGMYTGSEIQTHCVHHQAWQRFRLSLKGTSTRFKLKRLVDWWEANIKTDEFATRCQVTNYLYALKRGGQLGDNLEVKRER